MNMTITNTSNIHSIAELAKIAYSDSDIYYNYKELAHQNANTFLETIHTPSIAGKSKLSAATIVFADGSELIITKEIVSVITQPRHQRR